MGYWQTRAGLLVIGACACMAACGGIEGTGSPVAGIEGTGFTEGSTTGFGSVYVNGIEFATDRTDIRVDGQPATEDALQLGMVLAVVGEITGNGATGTASRIATERQLLGPVESVDLQHHEITVLGQAVCFDDRTVFVGVPETEIQPGDLLLVHGFLNSDGLLATRVERLDETYVPGTTVVDVDGIVRDLAAGQFRINELPVQFSSASVDASQAPLAEGAFVEVRGTQPQAGAALQADRVTVRLRPTPADGRPVSIEGVIQQFASLADFHVNGRRVDAAGAQRSDDTSLQPADDVRIRLTGLTREDGVLSAREFELLPAGEFSLTGRVEDLDQENQTISVLSRTQEAQPETQYQDSHTGLRRFRLENVQPGDFVELRGYTDQGGRRLLSRIERREAEEAPPIVLLGGLVVIDEELESVCVGDCSVRSVRGPLNSANSVRNTLVISGVDVSTNPATTRFTDRDGNPVTSMDFYSGLQPGDRLIADGTEASADTGAEIEARRVRYAYFQF